MVKPKEDGEDGKENINEESGEIEEPIKYEDMVTEEPEREVDIDEYEAPKTVSETRDEAPQKSDIQAILHAISPKSKYTRINDLVQPAMVSRIFPDNMLDKQKLAVLGIEEEYAEDDADIQVMDIIMNVQDIMSIGYG